MILTENMKYYRKKKGWTQRQLAEAANISYNSLTKYESGGRISASEDTIANLAIVLGVNTADIYDEREFIYDNPFNRIKEETRKRLKEQGYTRETWIPGNVDEATVKNRHFTAMMDILGHSFEVVKTGGVEMDVTTEKIDVIETVDHGVEAVPDEYNERIFISEEQINDFCKSCIDYMSYRAKQMIDEACCK